MYAEKIYTKCLKLNNKYVKFNKTGSIISILKFKYKLYKRIKINMATWYNQLAIKITWIKKNSRLYLLEKENLMDLKRVRLDIVFKKSRADSEKVGIIDVCLIWYLLISLIMFF